MDQALDDAPALALGPFLASRRPVRTQHGAPSSRASGPRRNSALPPNHSSVSLRLAKSANPLGWPGGRRARVGTQQARGSLGPRKPEAYATTGWWRCRDAAVLSPARRDHPKLAEKCESWRPGALGTARSTFKCASISNFEMDERAKTENLGRHAVEGTYAGID
jgi:hypothetical protein